MDFSFHLKQGQLLLKKEDAASIKKALEHFRDANKISGDDEMAKPKILYFLALGNYLIGQFEQAYKIAHKAQRSIDAAIENSIFVMDNMREILGDKEIEDLITHIENKHFKQIEGVNINYEFDENYLDFSKLLILYKSEIKKNLEPSFEIDKINDDLLVATFYGMCRANEDLIFFDKLKGDVLVYVDGYFSSILGGQHSSKRKLSNKTNPRANPDIIDEDRYLLIDQLRLSEFIDEFKSKSYDTEILLSFIENFSISITKDFYLDDELFIEDLICSNHILNKFMQEFRFYSEETYLEISEKFYKILNDSQMYLAAQWIKNNIFNTTTINEDELKSMNVRQRSELRRRCAQKRDIKSLLEIAKYRFKTGSTETNKTNFPELCYYFGRLLQLEELKEFLSDKEFQLFMLPKSCKELAQTLFDIGVKFPNLSDSELLYLDKKYSDSKTFELFDKILFDADKLSRPILKYDVTQLKIKHSEFSVAFLLELFDSFIKNESLDDGYSNIHIYDRVKNKIIMKRFDDIGLAEFAIIQPIISNEFYNLLMNKFGEKCAIEMSKSVCFYDDWEHFISSNHFLLNASTIVKTAKEYFNNESNVNDLKCCVSSLWLSKVNNKQYTHLM